MMDRKILLGVVALAAVSLSIALMLPEDTTVNNGDTLPWNIVHPTPYTTRVLGVTLGESTLEQAELKFEEAAVVSMFQSADSKLAVEAFFEEINLNGLKAKIVLTMEIPSFELPGIFDRGLRMNTTTSGKRITLSTEDLARVRKSPIGSLTYLPTVRLDEAVLIKRFGEPAQRVRETKTGAIHWLYPQHGLDITLGGDEKPLLQYLSPTNFELLSAPLLAQGEILK
ncbi:hypothetical protein GALLN_00931 [Gallionellaceae bacterium]|nr:hypothetical protein GALLN_00931 [Gallionellaceae bacterium]